MSPSVYNLLKSFDSQNRLDGTNYQAWAREFNMTFLEAGLDILGHVKGTSQVPSDPLDPGITAWNSVDASARMALYKTISSNAVCDVHFKETTPAQTANQVWESLKSEYQKDSRASRFLLKKRLYNPVHDINQPISVYIQDIIAAADALTSLGHPPSSLDVVDSIIMNLNSSFAIVRTVLTIQPNEPSLGAIKKMLTDQEDIRVALGSGELGEMANAFRKAGIREEPEEGSPRPFGFRR